MNLTKSNNTLIKLSKTALFVKCEELGITKYKSKNKEQLIELINGKTLINEKKIIKPQIEFIIDGPDEEYNEEEDDDNDNRSR